MRRLLALLIAACFVFGLTSCSDDEGDTASDEATTDDSTDDGSTDDSTPAAGGEGTDPDSEFCQTAEEQATVLESSGDDDGPSEEDLAALDELVETAPEVIQPDLETVQQTFIEISELEPDLASFEEALDLLFDPGFIGSLEQVGLYLEAECGIDIETPSEAGLDEGDEEPAGDGLEADALRAYVTAEDPAIEERIQSVVTVDGSEVGVGVRNLDDPAEAVAICEILSGYVYDEVGDADVTINVNDTSGETLASREDEEGACEAAA